MLTLDPTSYRWYNPDGPSEIDLAWAGGLFEGEGCLSASGTLRPVRIQAVIQLTDLDTLLRFQWSVQVGNINGPYTRKGVDYKPYWKWKITSRSQVEQFIFKILPYLCDRRQTKACELLSQTCS